MIVILLSISAVLIVILFVVVKIISARSALSDPKLEEEILQIKTKRHEQKNQLESLSESLTNREAVGKIVISIRNLISDLRMERGRATITDAELEGIEQRLCELEEIEREIEAANIETNEELKILAKRVAGIASGREALKAKLDSMNMNIEKVAQELDFNSDQIEQIQYMQGELIQTEVRVGELLSKLEVGNEMYAQLKRRYDALDIEYAQLYEKFSREGKV